MNNNLSCCNQRKDVLLEDFSILTSVEVGKEAVIVTTLYLQSFNEFHLFHRTTLFITFFLAIFGILASGYHSHPQIPLN
jgi:hypothetical protein